MTCETPAVSISERNAMFSLSRDILIAAQRSLHANRYPLRPKTFYLSVQEQPGHYPRNAIPDGRNYSVGSYPHHRRPVSNHL